MHLFLAANDDALVGMVFVGVFCGAMIFALAIQAVVCWYLAGCLKAIPEEHRKQQPNMVWLLMIPLFNIVWQFFVYPKIAESFKSYFDAQGRNDVGDAGKGLAMTYCILACCSIIPYLGACVSIAALVVWIMVLVKFGSFKGQINKPAAGNFPVV